MLPDESGVPAQCLCNLDSNSRIVSCPQSSEAVYCGMDSKPDLPKPRGDAENLRRLRQDAIDRVKEEEREERQRYPAPVYGGPPIDGPQKRSKGWLFLAIGALLALIAWLLARYRVWPLGSPAPVYGGPPVGGALLLPLGRWIRRIFK